MTAHDTLLSLLGEWVTVTHPGDEHRVWHGQLASMMDTPAIVLRMPAGGTEVLPQSFNVQAAAPARDRAYPDPDDAAQPFASLIDSGLLWLLNRYALHPRGLALALHVDEEGHAYGWSLVHNAEGEPWQYDQATDNNGRARAEATIAAELAGIPTPPAVPRCNACGGAPVVWETEDERRFCAGCVSCKCGRPDCAVSSPPAPTDDRPDTPSGHPDTASGRGGYVSMAATIGETTPALTMPDTVRTAYPDGVSGRPDGASAESTPRVLTRTAIADAFDLPAGLFEERPCDCGQRSPLVLVTPDGGHIHMDPAEHEKLERARLFGTQGDPHPAVAAWGQCWDRAENLRTRLALARQVLVDDGYFTEDEVGDDVAPRMVEWLSAHRKRTEELSTLFGEVLSSFTDATITDGVSAIHAEIHPETMTGWARALHRIRTAAVPRPTGQCARPECAAAREDVITAAGAWDVLRTNLITAHKYVARQQQSGFPLRGGDNRHRVLAFLAAWTADPGPLNLRTGPDPS